MFDTGMRGENCTGIERTGFAADAEAATGRTWGEAEPRARAEGTLPGRV